MKSGEAVARSGPELLQIFNTKLCNTQLIIKGPYFV